MTYSWVSARSHWPLSTMSWNSITRRLAFAGSLRTELCPSASRSASRLEPFASSVSFRVALTVSAAKLRRLRRGKLRGEPQRHREPLELVMRPEEELGRVVARVAVHLLDYDFGGRQRFLRLGGFG